jgi:hypothetical protein
MSSCRKLAISIAVRLAVSAASQRLVNALTGEVGCLLICRYGRSSESASSTLRAVAASSLFTSS